MTAQLILAALLSMAPDSNATPAGAVSSGVPMIQPGAVEIGLSGAFTSVEGVSHATASVRGGRFSALGRGLVAAGGEVVFSHASGLDEVALEAVISYQRRVRGGSLYPYVALAGGPRQEWLGSFREVRYPIGVTLGLRTLAGAHAATLLEYRLRRVLHDPVADFTEHQVVVGLSLLFHNRAR